MPETFGVVLAVVNALDKHLKLEVEYLPIRVFGNWKDTYEVKRLIKDKVRTLA